jgi:succinate-semialdehyde dehydrogenase/glutarate-semialdehyde dehydrogenase
VAELHESEGIFGMTSTTTAAYADLALYIDGEFATGDSRREQPVHDPATGDVIGQLPHARSEDLDRALAAAARAFESWKTSSPMERSRILRKVAELSRAQAETIGRHITLDQGKPLPEAIAEVLRCAEHCEWHAEECRRIYGRVIPPREPHVRQLVLREPVGVCAAFTPWNFPYNQAIRKVAAAVGAGCTIVLKGPEDAPAAVVDIARLFHEAGLPPGVLNIVWGVPADVSRHLIESPLVRKVSFTGSVPVGKQLAAMAGQHMKRVTMELGGHAPVIVCDDADIALAVKAAGGAKFRNAGQVCISPTRFLVHDSVKEEFAHALAAYAQGIKVADGLAEGTQMGPLANPRRLAAMTAFHEDAVAKGARVLAGGARMGEAGNFWAPTVLADVPLEARIFNDEPFGPVAAVRGFTRLEDAIAEANRLSYGLAGYAFTRSLKTTHLLSQDVEAGMLWINQPALPSAELPFGGIKDSGYGSEGGPEALEAYLVAKAVAITCV